jgi:hypothetical protein
MLLHIPLTACERDVWIVAERIGKAEKHLSDASNQGRENVGWLQQAALICKRAGHAGDAGVIHQLQELHGKVSAIMVYFQEHVAAAKELYREDWVISVEGRKHCKQMESADGKALRCVSPQPSTLNYQPSTLHAPRSTLNPPRSTLHAQPSTLHAQPTLKPRSGRS